MFLDGVYRAQEEGSDEPELHALAHLSTRDVALVLERTRDRMTKYLRRRGLLDEGAEGAEDDGSVVRAPSRRASASDPTRSKTSSAPSP